MKRTEMTTRCDADYTTRRTEIYSTGILESVAALLIMLAAIPVTAILMKGTIQTLNPPAKCFLVEEVKQ